MTNFTGYQSVAFIASFRGRAAEPGIRNAGLAHLDLDWRRYPSGFRCAAPEGRPGEDDFDLRPATPPRHALPLRIRSPDPTPHMKRPRRCLRQCGRGHVGLYPRLSPGGFHRLWVSDASRRTADDPTAVSDCGETSGQGLPGCAHAACARCLPRLHQAWSLWGLSGGVMPHPRSVAPVAARGSHPWLAASRKPPLDRLEDRPEASSRRWASVTVGSLLPSCRSVNLCRRI